LPEISPINSSPQLGVNAGQFSITPQNILVLGIEDGSMTCLVLNNCNQARLALLGKTGSDTLGELLGEPILTTHQSKPLSPFSCHCTWGMGRGRGIR